MSFLGLRCFGFWGFTVTCTPETTNLWWVTLHIFRNNESMSIRLWFPTLTSVLADWTISPADVHVFTTCSSSPLFERMVSVKIIVVEWGMKEIEKQWEHTGQQAREIQRESFRWTRDRGNLLCVFGELSWPGRSNLTSHIIVIRKPRMSTRKVNAQVN